MDLRATIKGILTEIFEEDGLDVPVFDDDLVLLETDLDSLGYAVLVTRLEEEIGYDPFSLMTEATYPTTFSEFIGIYEQFRKHARPSA